MNERRGWFRMRGALMAVAAAALVPTIAERLENGAWPGGMQEWIVEAISGSAILALGVWAVWTISEERDELERTLSVLDRLAKTDPLTGLGNARAWGESLLEASTSGQPYWVLVADVDRLKPVNDTRGHAAGDALLRRAADAFRAAPLEAAFRTGGDEFAGLVRGDETHAELAARSIASAMNADPDGASFSIGLSPLLAEESPWRSVDRADEGLYDAKRSGGRCHRVRGECSTGNRARRERHA